MKKMRLEIEALAVESFGTGRADVTGSGTVEGHSGKALCLPFQSWGFDPCDSLSNGSTCAPRNTCYNSCVQATECGYSCDPTSCDFTCGQTCDRC